jgi:hypothetical protein
VTDALFGIDIIVVFMSEYYDGDMNLISNHKLIAINYVKGWFFIDVLAIIPFEIIITNVAKGMNNLARIAKMGRLYKLVKLTRLLRILKVMKEKSKLMKYLNQFLKVGLSFERLFFFMLMFLMLCHIGACLWVMIAAFHSEDYIGTWLEPFIEEGLSPG